jgi:hypothetical protein
MIIGIAGLIIDPDGVPLGTAGAGKDTVAGFLGKRNNYVKVALADPLKRICMETYDFSYEQLWGPNELRNKPDLRYPRYHAHHDVHAIDDRQLYYRCSRCKKETDVNGQPPLADSCIDYLTPRESLQKLGTEWARRLYPDTWIDKLFRTADAVLTRHLGYIDREGVVPLQRMPSMQPFAGVAVSDVRFRNEIEGIRKKGGKLVRVKRPGQPLEGAAALHRSETESLEIPDDDFDYVLQNWTTLADLEMQVTRMMDVFGGRLLPYDPKQADIPPFLRR